jgi:hypothetical protein
MEETKLEQHLSQDALRACLELSILVALATFSGSFAAALTHEVIGHGLVGELLGHNFYAFYVSPVGESEAYIDLGQASDFEQGLVNAGGIASDILLGLLVFWLSDKQRRFAPKLLTFFWSADSLIGGSSYLAISSFTSFISGSPTGDPYWISYFLHIPLPVLAFSGLAICAAAYYFLFRKLAMLLADRIQFSNREEAFAFISSIWIFGSLLVQTISVIVENELGSKLLMAFFRSASILIMGYFASSNIRADPSRAIAPIGRRQFYAVSLVAIVSAATWLGVFGPTSREAHGIVLEEFPTYVNLRITLLENLTAIVQLAFRPGPFENAWPNLKGTNPRWEHYVEEAGRIASGMFGVEDFHILGYFTDNESFWYSGSWHADGARTVFLTIPKIRTEEMESGELALVLLDPWKPFGFIDSLNVTLNGLRLLNVTPRASIINSGAMESALWLNNSTDTSPAEYSLLLSRG